ncbi:zinc ribbon domain-containing protein [Paenibacillus sp. sgz302251]|uniref:zinc ribbon domain-containing protein n=1 Tax=Paenibacillus sp. sgz302251 TaxID=3414493 RepID=UPI003C7B95BA
MDLFKKLKSGASKAADVAQQTVEVTKLTAQIAARKREIDKYKNQLGHEVYTAYQSGQLTLAEEKVNVLCFAIQGVEAEISNLEMQIKRIRHEKSCKCGKVLDWDTKFCPNCGLAQEGLAAEIITIDPIRIDKK